MSFIHLDIIIENERKDRHPIPEVAPVVAHLPTDGAPVGLRPSLGHLLYESVQTLHII